MGKIIADSLWGDLIQDANNKTMQTNGKQSSHQRIVKRHLMEVCPPLSAKSATKCD